MTETMEGTTECQQQQQQQPELPSTAGPTCKPTGSNPENNNDCSIANSNLADALSESLSLGCLDGGRIASWLAKNHQFQQQVSPASGHADDADSGRPSSVDEATVKAKGNSKAYEEDEDGEEEPELSHPGLTGGVQRNQVGRAIVRGASPVPGDVNDVIHQFLIPNRLGGSMVGTRGRNISYIRAKSGASVWISRNFFDKKTQVVNVRGPVDCVKIALQVIRKRFPDLDVKPINTSVPLQRNPALQPSMVQLSLPFAATIDVNVCAMCHGTMVFLQQPTHPSYHHLEKMDATIKRHYGGGIGDSPQSPPPCLPRPVNPGAVCVAPFGDSWHRAIIADVFPEEDAVLMKYLDWGGYEKMSVNCLKQIRTEMMHLPFQAVEAHLAYVSPALRQQAAGCGSIESQLEEISRAAHKRFLSGRRRVKCQVMYLNDLGQPCVYLYARDPGDTQWRFVQEELVQAGLMQWFQMPHPAPQLPQASATAAAAVPAAAAN